MENSDLLKRIGVLPKLVRFFKHGFRPDFKVNIKKSEVSLLMELKHNPGHTMKDYLGIVDMEPGSFTYLTDKLEKKGLLRRVRSDTDRRKTTLELTGKGSELTEKLMEQFDVHMYQKLKKLSADDRDLLLEAIITLEYILEKLEKLKAKNNMKN